MLDTSLACALVATTSLSHLRLSQSDSGKQSKMVSPNMYNFPLTATRFVCLTLFVHCEQHHEQKKLCQEQCT